MGFCISDKRNDLDTYIPTMIVLKIMLENYGYRGYLSVLKIQYTILCIFHGIIYKYSFDKFKKK